MAAVPDPPSRQLDEVPGQPGRLRRISGHFRHTDGEPNSEVTDGSFVFRHYLGANGNTGGSGWSSVDNTVEARAEDLTDQWQRNSPLMPPAPKTTMGRQWEPSSPSFPCCAHSTPTGCSRSTTCCSPV